MKDHSEFIMATHSFFISLPHLRGSKQIFLQFTSKWTVCRVCMVCRVCSWLYERASLEAGPLDLNFFSSSKFLLSMFVVVVMFLKSFPFSINGFEGSFPISDNVAETTSTSSNSFLWWPFADYDLNKLIHKVKLIFWKASNLKSQMQKSSPKSLKSLKPKKNMLIPKPKRD